MDKKEQILHYHRIDGLSQREIARRVGVSRKTVKRYITEYEALAQADPEDGINMCLASEPKYPTRKIERSRLTEPVCAEIEYWLSENAKRRLTGMRKQCLKKQDIHRALIEKGFTVSYSSVCKYIQQRKAEKSPLVRHCTSISLLPPSHKQKTLQNNKNRRCSSSQSVVLIIIINHS